MEIVSVNSSSVTLQWEPPDIINGVVRQYSLYLDGTNIVNISSSVLMYSIGGLSPDTVYVLQLRAHTGAGPGSSIRETFLTCKLNNICSMAWMLPNMHDEYLSVLLRWASVASYIYEKPISGSQKLPCHKLSLTCLAPAYSS